jgi:hypothetical protein
MPQGSGTVNFPAGEKLTAGSWKAMFSEIGRAEPYSHGAMCVIADCRWHVCARALQCVHRRSLSLCVADVH